MNEQLENSQTEGHQQGPGMNLGGPGMNPGGPGSPGPGAPRPASAL